jgi:hypothetical protein
MKQSSKIDIYARIDGESANILKRFFNLVNQDKMGVENVYDHIKEQIGLFS